jgi:hypothetical protein
MQKVFAAVTDNNILPIVQTGVAIEEAKKNTLLFILIMTIFLILLVGVGYLLEGRKKGKNKNLIVIGFTVLAGVIFAIPAKAFCPVCTIAVGAGLTFTKALGIDDVISSIWVGGVLLSSSLWLINWLDSKKIRFFMKRKIVYLVMYGLVIIPFISSKTIGAGHNQLWGIDKIVLGIVLGTIGFMIGMAFNNRLLKNNNDKVYFPFQKVVLPIGALIILSLIFFFIVY